MSKKTSGNPDSRTQIRAKPWSHYYPNKPSFEYTPDDIRNLDEYITKLEKNIEGDKAHLKYLIEKNIEGDKAHLKYLKKRRRRVKYWGRE